MQSCIEVRCFCALSAYQTMLMAAGKSRLFACPDGACQQEDKPWCVLVLLNAQAGTHLKPMPMKACLLETGSSILRAKYLELSTTGSTT